MHPYLKKVGDSSQLYVNGKPFLILGAELHNSTASNLKFLEPVLPRLVDYNINTVFLPISWGQIEPEEDNFDFGHLDGLLNLVSSYGLKIGLLWFGSFKNGESSYIPNWVKQNPKKFVRSTIWRNGKLTTTKTLSVFYEDNWKADAKAFNRLMSHLQDKDKASTVIMVQVENESGVLWDSRDRLEISNKLYKEHVPEELLTHLSTTTLSKSFQTRFSITNKSGSWETVFGEGEDTEELFMSWYYAKYLDKVAEAGKSVYPIPLFINAALNIADSLPRKVWKRPNQYPCGGVLPHTMDIYNAAISHIDMYSPDIYADEFEEFCDAYRHGDNALLIPETRRDYYAAERMFYAYGKCKAIGVSPFGIDSVWEESILYKKHFGILKQVSSKILKAQAEDKIFGFHFDNKPVVRPMEHSFGFINIHIDRLHSYGKPQSGFGLVIQTDEYEFLGVGFGFNVVFSSNTGRRVEIMSIEEGHYPDGVWEQTRLLNGDESASNSRWDFATVKPDFGEYKVPICYPATTAISKCKVFVHEDIYGVFP